MSPLDALRRPARIVGLAGRAARAYESSRRVVLRRALHLRFRHGFRMDEAASAGLLDPGAAIEGSWSSPAHPPDPGAPESTRALADDREQGGLPSSLRSGRAAGARALRGALARRRRLDERRRGSGQSRSMGRRIPAGAAGRVHLEAGARPLGSRGSRLPTGRDGRARDRGRRLPKHARAARRAPLRAALRDVHAAGAGCRTIPRSRSSAARRRCRPFD